MDYERTSGYINWLDNMTSAIGNVRFDCGGTITFQGHTYDAFRNLVAFDAHGGKVFYVDDVDKNDESDEVVVDKKSIDDFLGEFRVVE